MKHKKFFKTVLQKKNILIIFILIALAGSLSQYFKGQQYFDNRPYTHYNNYVIFKNSFQLLADGQDLYQLHPNLYWDYYKYSPTFAVVMLPFSLMPDLPGLMLWNLLNAIAIFMALNRLKLRDEKATSLALLFVLLELLTSLQNAQSNGLMAALMIFTFVFIKEHKPAMAALSLISGFYIKIFGILAGIQTVFSRDKLRIIILSVFWAIFFLLIPLLFISPQQLFQLYKNWFTLLMQDQDVSVGISLMGIMDSWFGLAISKNVVTVAGLILLLLPLLNIKTYHEIRFQLNFLASLLIWVVIFNHKAESPTYIIAMTGIAIWYFSARRTGLDFTLLIIAFILTSLSSTDIFPRYIREQIMMPYKLKALPSVLIWIKIQYEMLSPFQPPDFVYRLKSRVVPLGK